MKIAYILGEFPSLTETFILREMVALSTLGAEIIVFALRRGELSLCHDEARIFLSQTVYPTTRSLARRATAGVHTVRLFLPDLHVLKYLAGPGICGVVTFLRRLHHLSAALEFTAECLHRHIEHIHAHFAYVPSDVATIMSSRSGIPMSISVHAWDIYTQSPLLTKSRLRRAEFVTCCTSHVHRLLTEWMPDMSSRIFMVRHGLPLDQFSPPQDRRLPRVVAIGRLVPKKGFSCLIEACGLLKQRQIQFDCVIVGEGPLRRRLESLIAHLRLTDRVRLVGAMSQQDIRRLLASASVLVAPSIVAPNGDRDGLPNAVLEALALETPAVVTDASAAQEVIVDGWNGFVVPSGDPGAIAMRVEELVRDSARRTGMGKAGRQTVEAEFDVQRNAVKLLGLFKGAQRRSDSSRP
ncbi:MAG: glycosyltransferase family 4 protein [Kiritimatiellae bacterium]|nr:glycosyltransferase family 4 protein [Kiritimatiellia bacterium]